MIQTTAKSQSKLTLNLESTDKTLSTLEHNKSYCILTLRQLMRPPVWLSQLDLQRGTNFDQYQPKYSSLCRLCVSITSPAALAVERITEPARPQVEEIRGGEHCLTPSFHGCNRAAPKPPHRPVQHQRCRRRWRAGSRRHSPGA